MQAIETTKGESSPSAPPATTGTTGTNKTYGIGMIAFAIFNFLGFVGILVCYLVFVDIANEKLSEATKICDTDADAIQIMEDVPQQLIETWAYNITNPAEYLEGGDAQVHELGVYAWDFNPQIENIEVNYDTMEFDLYNADARFNKDESCPACETTDTVFSQFTPYSALMGGAKSEAVVMLSMTCSPQQIMLIANNLDAPIDYCNTTEMMSTVTCRCCSPTPNETATTCSALATTSTKPAGMLSWLAKYDGGYQLSTTPNANFPLSSGDYTGLVRKTNIQELTLGHTSTMIGFFKMNLALQQQDSEAVAEFAKNTEDMKDACTPLDYCPEMMTLVQQIMANPNPQATFAILKAIDCSGIIPSADVLENTHGLTNARSLELRYLEGTDCRPYGLTLAISTLIFLQAQQNRATYSCANPGHSLPCCMSQFSSAALGGDGSAVGCLGWANGYIQSRNLYSLEEANKYIEPAPHAKSYTQCAAEGLQYTQEMWHGRDKWNSWFTPDTYAYPAMSWADFSTVSGAKAGTTAGEYTVYDLEGTQMAMREGRGITTGFLEYDLTDGEPKNKKETIWAPFRLSGLDFEHVESFEYQELQVAYMKPLIQTEFTDAEIESRQRIGEMPYPNQKNVAHSRGVPVVLGYPNFYKVDPAILSQSSNAERYAPPGSEIQLFRTRDGYEPTAALLAAAERVTTDSLEAFGDDFEGDFVIEPATGVTLDARVVTMISNYVWQCNPSMEKSCGFQMSAYNDADPLCYGNGAQQFPCSVMNVFTPKVHGGKVMPVFWIRSLAVTSEDLVDTLLGVSDTRFALGISVIVLPVLFFVGFVFALVQIKSVYYPAAVDESDETSRLSKDENAL